jgi:hypothetical protein
VELGSTLFAPCTLLSLGCTPFACLCFLGMPFGGRCVLRRAFTLVFGIVMLLSRRGGVGLGFLLVPSGLTAKPLALTFALAAPPLDGSSGYQQQKGDQEYDADDDGDYGNR